MRNDQTPTVFVSLLPAPNQFGLFDEVIEEAIDIVEAAPDLDEGMVRQTDNLALIDLGNLRIAIGWCEGKTKDVLSFAVAARPNTKVTENEARIGADMLRDLQTRAEALLDVPRSLYQVSLLPLSADTLVQQARHVEALDPDGPPQPGSPFITVEPQVPADPEEAQMEEPQTVEEAEERAAGSDWTLSTTTLALSGTFVLVTPPVGLAMLAYTALRQGTEMNLLPKSLNLSMPEKPSMPTLPMRGTPAVS